MDLCASSTWILCSAWPSSLQVAVCSKRTPPISGELCLFYAQVWRIENLELVPVEHQWYGFFYGGDCYLVLYTYEMHGKPHYILYICQVGLGQALSFGSWCFLWPLSWGRGWQGPIAPFSPVQGRHASQDELAASAYQAVEVDLQFEGAPVQVRVTMGKEPRHFMAIFKGKLVIFEVRNLR